MSPHGPHKDSWRYHPHNTINVWAALSDATPLNGMMIIPHTVDYSPKFANNEIIYGCDTYPEKQYITQMKSGDVLLFRLSSYTVLFLIKQIRPDLLFFYAMYP